MHDCAQSHIFSCYGAKKDLTIHLKNTDFFQDNAPSSKKLHLTLSLSVVDSPWLSPVSSPARTEVIKWRWLERAAGEDSSVGKMLVVCAWGTKFSLSKPKSQTPHSVWPSSALLPPEASLISASLTHLTHPPEAWLIASLVMQGCIFNFPTSEFYPGSALISSCKEIVACFKTGRRSLMLPVQVPSHTAILVFPELAFAWFQSGSKFISVILESR